MVPERVLEHRSRLRHQARGGRPHVHDRVPYSDPLHRVAAHRHRLLVRARVVLARRLHGRRGAGGDRPLALLEVARPVRAVMEDVPRGRRGGVRALADRHFLRQAARVPLDERVVRTDAWVDLVAIVRILAGVTLDVAAGVVRELMRHVADRRLGQPVRPRFVHVARHAVVRRHVAGLVFQVAAQVVVEPQRAARRRRARDIGLRFLQAVQVVVGELLFPLGPARRRPRDAALERAVAAPGVGVVLDRRRVPRRVDALQPPEFVVGPLGPHAVAVAHRLRLAVGGLGRHVHQHRGAVLQLRRVAAVVVLVLDRHRRRVVESRPYASYVWLRVSVVVALASSTIAVVTVSSRASAL